MPAFRRATVYSVRVIAASLVLAPLLAGCGGGRTALFVGAAERQDAAAGGGAGDAAADSGAIRFPTGTFTDCAMGEHNPDGSVMNLAGFEPGSTLELTENGATVTATFIDFNGLANSLDFSPVTNTSATLAHAGQVDGGFKSICVQGVGVSHEQFHTAILDATSGALIANGGSIFLSTAGTLAGHSGPCGKVSVPGVFWVACRQGPAAPVDSGSPLVVPKLPVGSFACSSQVETLFDNGGKTYLVSSGGDGGSLQLSQSGRSLMAEYSDKYVAGTLQLRITSPTTAFAETEQGLAAPCQVPDATAGGPAAPFPVAGGALAVDGPTLVLSFAGTLGAGSSCSGAEKAGSLICTKQ